MAIYNNKVLTATKKFGTRFIQFVSYYRLLQSLHLRKIRKKQSANVVFFATNLAMWRYQQLYEKLATDKRFNLKVVITTFDTYTKESQRQQTEELIHFFEKNSVDYVLLDDLPQDKKVKALSPDVLFYVQPYHQFGKNACFTSFRNKLIAYYPYGLQNVKMVRGYNMRFHNVAWRIYYPTPIHIETARELSAVNAENAVLVGEPHADSFMAPVNVNPWKKGDDYIHIIWAPHFSINPNKKLYRPSFLWTSELMLDIAKRYSDRINIAFKPHPRLFTELCKHPDWGEKRATEYYEQWKNMPNTQFEDGEFIELFKTSDALIHDCGSFTAEYQYTRRPCLFLTRDEKAVRKGLCKFGNLCMDNHYIAKSTEDITRFIEDVLLNGNDDKAQQRHNFYDDYLLPPYGNTTAQNTYNDIVSSLFGDKVSLTTTK